MVSISTDDSVMTVIHAYTVAPGYQRELAARLVEAIDRFGHSMAGHLSSSVHLADDGTRVTSYSQWQAAEAKSLFGDPAAMGALLEQFKPYVATATGQDVAIYHVFSAKSFR